MQDEEMSDESHESTDLKEQGSDVRAKCDKYFKEAAGYIKTLSAKFKEYEDFYDGHQWKFSDGVRPVQNLIFANIQGQLPILTDSRPAVDVVPIEADENSFNKAKMLSSALAWVFEKQSLQLKNTQLLCSMLKTGTAFFYVDFDPDLEGGLGDVTIKELDWRYCFPDPNATNIDECLYFGIKIPMRASEIKRKYPAFKEDIKDESMSMDGQSREMQKYINPDRWDGYGGLDDGQQSYKLNDMVMYQEMWHKDYTTEPVPKEDTLEEITKEATELMSGKAPDITQYEDHELHIESHEELKQVMLMNAAVMALQLQPEFITEQDLAQVAQLPEVALFLAIIDDHIEAHREYQKINPDGHRPKYSKNLRLTIYVNETVMYDGAPPVDDGMIPIAPAYCYKDNKSFWATGEIKNIIDSQKVHNELGWKELVALAQTTNPITIVDEQANVEADTITNDPDLVIVKHKDGEITRLAPGVVSPQLSIRQDREAGTIDKISGVPEVSQGRSPTGITAARAVEALREAANGRIRLKSKNYEEYTLPRVGRLCLSRIIKYWNTERMLRLYDDEGKIQFIKFDPNEVANFEYDIKVVQGTSMGYSKAELFSYMSNLVESGKVPAKALFQTQDVPYRTKILEILEQEDQKNQLIQQQMMQIEQLTQLLQPANDGQGKK